MVKIFKEKTMDLTLVIILVLVAIGVIFILSAKKTAELDNPVEALQSHYHPNKGSMGSWWQRLRSESRSKLLAQLNIETQLLFENMEIQNRAIRQSQLEEMQHNYAMNFTASQIKLLDLAAQAHLDVPTFIETNRYMLLKSVDLQEQATLKKLDYEIERSLRSLDHSARKELKGLELLVDYLMSDREIDKERKLMELDMEAGNRLDTAGVEVINKLSDHLFKLVDLRNAESNQNKIKLLNNNINFLKDLIDAKKERLLIS
jgi:cob(I)alamin adenosyltransferase